MVVPVVDMRTSSNGQLGQVLSHTRTKLVPRKGVTDAWFDELNDILSAYKLTAITYEKQPPSLQELVQNLPGVPFDMVEALLNAISTQWWHEATTLYQIVRASIDLSGIFEKKESVYDQSVIRQWRLSEWARVTQMGHEFHQRQ